MDIQTFFVYLCPMGLIPGTHYYNKKKIDFHNFAEHLQKARGTPVLCATSVKNQCSKYSIYFVNYFSIYFLLLITMRVSAFLILMLYSSRFLAISTIFLSANVFGLLSIFGCHTVNRLSFKHKNYFCRNYNFYPKRKKIAIDEFWWKQFLAKNKNNIYLTRIR